MTFEQLKEACIDSNSRCYECREKTYEAYRVCMSCGDGALTPLDNFASAADFPELEYAIGKLQIKFALDEGAYAPECAHPGWDAGWDLRCREAVILKAGEHHTFDTGVHVETPKGSYFEARSKSGLNVNHQIMTVDGTIDAGFSGAISVTLFNFGKKDYTFKVGDKITQLVIAPFRECEFVLVEKVQGGERGDSGYGSTGR